MFVLLILIVFDYLCSITLQKYIAKPVPDYYGLFYPKKRTFLFFYRKLSVESTVTAITPWGMVCRRKRMCAKYDVKEVFNKN